MKVKCIRSNGNTGIGLKYNQIYEVIYSTPIFYKIDTGFFGKQLFLKSRFIKED